MTIWEILDKAWSEYIKYQEAMDENRNTKIKGVRKNQDQEEILWEIAIDEYYEY